MVDPPLKIICYNSTALDFLSPILQILGWNRKVFTIVGQADICVGYLMNQ